MIVSQADCERVLGKKIEREYSLAQLLSRPNTVYEELMTLKKADGSLVSDKNSEMRHKSSKSTLP